MKFSVKGVDSLIAEIAKKQKSITEEGAAKIKHELVDRLKERTPVDTGEARDGWQIDQKGNIVNPVEHIAALNNGHSNQAPAHFVEQTVISFEKVVPNGIIVANK